MDRSWDAFKDAFVVRLRMAMKGTSINAFARKAGLSASSVHRILHGGEPSLSSVFQMANAAGVSANWLMTGWGADLDGQQNSHLTVPPGFASGNGQTSLAINEGEVKIRSLSSHHIVSFDQIQSHVLYDDVRFPKSILNELGLKADEACLVQVSGTAMEPLLRDGSVVLIDTADTLLAEGRIYAFTLNGEVMVKRLRPSRGKIFMVSENRTMFPDERIARADDFEVAGRVKWAGQRL